MIPSYLWWGEEGNFTGYTHLLNSCQSSSLNKGPQWMVIFRWLVVLSGLMNTWCDLLGSVYNPEHKFWTGEKKCLSQDTGEDCLDTNSVSLSSHPQLLSSALYIFFFFSFIILLFLLSMNQNTHTYISGVVGPGIEQCSLPFLEWFVFWWWMCCSFSEKNSCPFLTLCSKELWCDNVGLPQFLTYDSCSSWYFL